MALSSCHCPSCLAVVSNSTAAIRGRRFVVMLRRRPEHGDGFEAIEFAAETIGEASKKVGRIWAGRDDLYLPDGTLMELKRVKGQPCERLWVGKWSCAWREVGHEESLEAPPTTEWRGLRPPRLPWRQYLEWGLTLGWLVWAGVVTVKLF